MTPRDAASLSEKPPTTERVEQPRRFDGEGSLRRDFWIAWRWHFSIVPGDIGTGACIIGQRCRVSTNNLADG